MAPGELPVEMQKHVIANHIFRNDLDDLGTRGPYHPNLIPGLDYGVR